MKDISKKILSIFLIPIVLFSTTSFNVEKHICLENVFSISVFGEADGCGMESDICDEEDLSGSSVFADDCCSVEKQIVTGLIFNKIKENRIQVEQTFFNTLFIDSSPYLFGANLNKISLFEFYTPPEVIKNRSVLYQVFII